MTTEGAAPAPSENNPLPGPGQQGRPNPALAGARVLVVDDDHLALRTLERTLRAVGVVVTPARGLSEARMFLGRETFDGAVVDLRLGEGRGVDLITELRASELPCCSLMITGSRGVDVAREVLASGADDFLLKPFEAKAFLDAVGRTITKTRDWRARLARATDQTAGDGPLTDEPAALSELESADLAPDSGDLEGAGEEAVLGKPGRLLASPSLPTIGAVDLKAFADALTRLGELSAHERGVLVLMLRGHSNSEIAAQLGRKERTVKFHVSNVLRKLRVTNRGDLLRFFF